MKRDAERPRGLEVAEQGLHAGVLTHSRKLVAENRRNIFAAARRAGLRPASGPRRPAFFPESLRRDASIHRQPGRLSSTSEEAACSQALGRQACKSWSCLQILRLRFHAMPSRFDAGSLRSTASRDPPASFPCATQN